MSGKTLLQISAAHLLARLAVDGEGFFRPGERIQVEASNNVMTVCDLETIPHLEDTIP